jgi:hypothetical protein
VHAHRAVAPNQLHHDAPLHPVTPTGRSAWPIPPPGLRRSRNQKLAKVAKLPAYHTVLCSLARATRVTANTP